MDNKDIARELVKMAKKITSGIGRNEIIELVSKSNLDLGWVVETLLQMSKMTKEFSSDTPVGRKNVEYTKLLQAAYKKAIAITKKYEAEIEEEMQNR